MDNTSIISANARKKLDKVFSILPFLSVLLMNWRIDNDTYWILKTGEYICNNGIPSKDFLTFHTSMDLVVQQWLSDVIFFKTYELFGRMGLMAILIVVYILFVYLFRRFCLLLTDKRILVSVVTLVVGFIMNSSIVTRPQSFTYCIVLIELICLERFVQSGKIKHLLVLPLLSVLIVNLHASMWTMQFIVMLPYFANALPIKIKGKSISCCKLLPLVGTAIASGVCGLITPYGIKGLSFIFTTSLGDKVNDSIMELKPLTISTSSPYDTLMFAAVMVAPLCYLLYKKGKLVPRFALLCVGTALMALMYRKLMAYYYLCAIPAALAYLDTIDYKAIITKLAENDEHESSKSTRKVLIAAISVMCVGMFAFTVSDFVFNGIDFAHTDGEKAMDEVIAVMQNDIERDGLTKDDVILYNGFNSGGYLEFKGYKTYIDARADSFVDEANHDFDYLTEYNDMKKGKIYYKDVMDKYGFDYAFVELGVEKPIYIYLSKDSDYQKLCETKDYALFKLVK